MTESGKTENVVRVVKGPVEVPPGLAVAFARLREGAVHLRIKHDGGTCWHVYSGDTQIGESVVNPEIYGCAWLVERGMGGSPVVFTASSGYVYAVIAQACDHAALGDASDGTIPF